MIIWFNSVSRWRIECPQCDIRFSLGAGEKEKIKERIIEAWNRRACGAEITAEMDDG